MYAASRNSIQQQSLISHVRVICLHLTQRFMTLKFFSGVLTGIFFTILIYHGKEPNHNQPKFRPDQSKFEYEKNELSSDEADLSKASAWNHTWDRFVL